MTAPASSDTDGPAGEAGDPISAQDPELILAGIKQFGLAPDGSDLRDLAARLAALQQERDGWKDMCDKATARLAEYAKGWTEDRASLQRRVETLTGEREVLRVEAFEEVAGLAVPAFAYDDQGVFTGIERYREQIKLYAANARAALTPEQGG